MYQQVLHDVHICLLLDSASKNEKATRSGSCVGPARPRLRSSSDGSIYTRRTVGDRSSFSSLTLSNPKSGIIWSIFKATAIFC